MNSEKDIFIPRETIQRLLNDVKYIIKNPLKSEGIYYQHDETDLLKGYALIFGPTDSLYKYGAYLFEFNFPTNYPHAPPAVKFFTNDGNIRFHPNLYRNGKVCLSILNTWNGEPWTACMNINTILLTILSILDKTPLLHEPGITALHKDFINYNKIIEYKNLEIAIFKMLDLTTGILPKHFMCFYDIIKDNYIKEYKNIDNIVKTITNGKKVDDITLQIYNNSRILLDYPKLEKMNKLLYKKMKKNKIEI